MKSKADKATYDMKKVYGGLLVQDYDETLFAPENLKVVTKRAPTEEEMKAMMFNWKVVKHTKSNAIVVGKADRTTGIGMGQTNRIWAAQQAIEHAGDKAKNSVMASDAFFPFSDNIERAFKSGVSYVAQPGGSVRRSGSRRRWGSPDPPVGPFSWAEPATGCSRCRGCVPRHILPAYAHPAAPPAAARRILPDRG